VSDIDATPVRYYVTVLLSVETACPPVSPTVTPIHCVEMAKRIIDLFSQRGRLVAPLCPHIIQVFCYEASWRYSHDVILNRAFNTSIQPYSVTIQNTHRPILLGGVLTRNNLSIFDLSNRRWLKVSFKITSAIPNLLTPIWSEIIAYFS